MKTLRMGLALGALALASYNVTACGGSSSGGDSGSSSSGKKSSSGKSGGSSSGSASGDDGGDSGESGGGESGSSGSAKSGSSGGGSSGSAKSGSSGEGSTGSTGGGTGEPVEGDQSAETYVNEGGWYAATTNRWGIQGSCYAYSDKTSVTVPEGGSGNAWNADKSAYCIEGATEEDPTYQKWGGGIGCDLGGQPEDEEGLLKEAFDWKAKHVTAFHLAYDFEGEQVVRVMYPTQKSYDDGGVAPFITATGTGEYQITKAKVPATWDVPNKGFTIVDEPVYSVQVQVVGADTGSAGPFKLCLTEFWPIE